MSLSGCKRHPPAAKSQLVNTRKPLQPIKISQLVKTRKLLQPLPTLCSKTYKYCCKSGLGAPYSTPLHWMWQEPQLELEIKPLHAFALLWTSYSLSFGDLDSGHNTEIVLKQLAYDVMLKSQNLPMTTREPISDAKAGEFLLPSSSWGSHCYRGSG